jgi:hypothetical protein
MVKSCRFEPSLVCPFSECNSDSVEDCNLRSGRFSNSVSKPFLKRRRRKR